ncbi:hypothetical protein HYH02_002038 [Chlamydomonas schloesseri]|uniref:Dienelactone hydrolase domain-containing protein n=1 Tax=Chlamydomonas schloesseri TaxID=2026947 RepID=A0A836BBU9_9CHLO|nr:hypothetical protein HYH02_002038 [Chlamydomonas schloesseri]|eukprot:KAG2453831.1 hypothetical protein HYH02_002038 [Chlamydomonas schloesseri]
MQRTIAQKERRKSSVDYVPTASPSAARTRRASCLVSDALLGRGQQGSQAAEPAYDYTPKGSFGKTGKIKIYTVGAGASRKRYLIVVPDIFGLESLQFLQACDQFAESGLTVIAFDPFLGLPWTTTRFPPRPEYGYERWLQVMGSWGRVEPMLEDAVRRVQQMAAEAGDRAAQTRIGCFGFGWGGMVALMAGRKTAGGQGGGGGSLFYGVGAANPDLAAAEAAGLDPSWYRAVKCPVVLLYAKGELPVMKLMEVNTELRTTFGAGGSLVQLTDTEANGVVARGDWAQPETAAAAGRVIAGMVAWLKKHFDGEKI